MREIGFMGIVADRGVILIIGSCTRANIVVVDRGAWLLRDWLARVLYSIRFCFENIILSLAVNLWRFHWNLNRSRSLDRAVVHLHRAYKFFSCRNGDIGFDRVLATHTISSMYILVCFLFKLTISGIFDKHSSLLSYLSPFIVMAFVSNAS